MPFYSPSSFSQGYPSYLPRQSYRPASYFLPDEPSSGFSFEDDAYPILLRASPPRVDAATRYRRALHELEAAEQDLGAHIALERARQVAIARQRAAAAEAARHERALAVQAEIERIQYAHALQAQVDEGTLAQRQRAHRARTAFGQARGQGRDLLHALLGADAEGAPVPQRCSAERLPTRSQPVPSPARDGDDGALALGDFLKIFAGVHPEPQPTGAPERSTSPPSQPHHPVEQPQHPLALGDLLKIFAGVHPDPQPTGATERSTPPPSQPHHPVEQPQPQPPRQDGLTEFLGLLHGIGAQVRDAAGRSQSTHQPNVPSQADAAPVNEKAKGKAKAAPVPEPTSFRTLFHDFLTGAPDQEMRDLEQAIKLSLQDRDTADTKKARASSPGASSSKVKIAEGVSSRRTAAPAPASASTPTPAPQPISPLTAIRAARTQLSALESAFKFPPVLDFNNHSELAASANNAPVRAYEQALNGLLEQLDAIESDGDEEVRDVRREVVREVERALEDVERLVEERAPRATAVAATAAKEGAEGYGVESEEPEAAPAPATAPGTTAAVVPLPVPVPEEDDKPASPDVAPAASPADADVDQAISKEYQSTRPPVAVVAEGLDNAVATDGVGVSSSSSSTPSAAAAAADADADAAPSAATPSPSAETFLASMSHDQFTFPPKPASRARTGSESGGAPQDDAVLAYGSSEGEDGSVKGADDGWSEV